MTTFPPKIVQARAPSFHRDGRVLRLALSQETWNNAIECGALDKIGQYFLVQTGVPVLAADGRFGLMGAHALWQGLKRPLGFDRDAPDFYAYILRPNTSFTLASGEAGKFSLLPEQPPENCVFMVTVEIPPDEKDTRLAGWGSKADGGKPAEGMIHDWDWVPSDRHQRDQPSLPDQRFESRHW